jgi:hypothetical protein
VEREREREREREVRLMALGLRRPSRELQSGERYRGTLLSLLTYARAQS